jgi:hypothetical protein
MSGNESHIKLLFGTTMVHFALSWHDVASPEAKKV